MKIRIRLPGFSWLAIAVLGFLFTPRLHSQVFKNLHSFTGGQDGANPYGLPFGVAISGNTLYGAATFGGSSGNGTVFSMSTDGTDFANLHSFAGATDGTAPNGAILAGGVLYGTTLGGGSSGNGAIFALNTNGSFTNLHSFTLLQNNTNADGANPICGVVLVSNVLYGTTTNGGSFGNGSIFAINTDGSGFRTLHSFTALNNFINDDGASPQNGVIASGGKLYGTASFGGAYGNGTIFSVNPDGTGFTNLYSFSPLDLTDSVNGDGAYPNGLVVSGNRLYGTANIGGYSGSGTIFALNTNGTGFTNLYSFSIVDSSTGANADGAFPLAGLSLSGSTLYGTASSGGAAGNGVVFTLKIDGSGFTNLHNFSALNLSMNSDGAVPLSGVFPSGNVLYGTAFLGGASSYGAVFSLSFPSPPYLSLTYSRSGLILSWPTNEGGFALQAATNLAAPIVWSAVLQTPSVVGGQNTVTDLMSGPRKFYRLMQ